MHNAPASARGEDVVKCRCIMIRTLIVVTALSITATAPVTSAKTLIVAEKDMVSSVATVQRALTKRG